MIFSYIPWCHGWTAPFWCSLLGRCRTYFVKFRDHPDFKARLWRYHAGRKACDSLVLFFWLQGLLKFQRWQRAGHGAAPVRSGDGVRHTMTAMVAPSSMGIQSYYETWCWKVLKPLNERNHIFWRTLFDGGKGIFERRTWSISSVLEHVWICQMHRVFKEDRDFPWAVLRTPKFKSSAP